MFNFCLVEVSRSFASLIYLRSGRKEQRGHREETKTLIPHRMLSLGHKIPLGFALARRKGYVDRLPESANGPTQVCAPRRSGISGSNRRRLDWHSQWPLHRESFKVTTLS